MRLFLWLTSPIRTLATIGSWAFVLGSLVAMTTLLQMHNWNSKAHSAIIEANLDGVVYNGFGLDFNGLTGSVVMAAVTGLVALAALVSMLRWTKPRRIALLILLAWSALWAGDYLWVGWRMQSFGMWLTMALYTGSFMCISCRTLMRWPARARRASRKRPAPLAIPAPADDFNITRSPVV